MEVLDDSDLVRKSLDGNLDSYAELVRRHSPMAFRVAMRITGQQHDAEDVVQESLIAAWQQLSTFNETAQFSTWLFRIVTRRALNRAQRRPDHPTGSDLLEARPDPGDGAVEHYERGQEQQAVAEAIQALPAPQRAVVVLYYFERLSYAEIAEATGFTSPAVRSHLFRARRAMGTALAQWR